MVAVVSWLPSSSGPNLLPPESLSFLPTLFTYDNAFLELLGGLWLGTGAGPAGFQRVLLLRLLVLT